MERRRRQFVTFVSSLVQHPLSLAAELTFIILANEPRLSAKDTAGRVDIDWLKSLPMVGDVNLFLKGDPSDEDFEAEVEIMIAGVSAYSHA